MPFVVALGFGNFLGFVECQCGVVGFEETHIRLIDEPDVIA